MSAGETCAISERRGRDHRAKLEDPLEHRKNCYMARRFRAARADTAHVLLVVRARRRNDLCRSLRHSLKGGPICEDNRDKAAEVAGRYS